MKIKYQNMLLLTATVTVMNFIMLIRRRRTKSKNKRTIWSREWLQRRQEGKGVLSMLNSELLIEDRTSYRNFLRLTNEQFEYLLNKVKKYIAKKDTFMRDSISARSRLEVTLRFLATGETYRSLMYSTRIHESTISRFVPEVCNAINEVLKPYLKTPQSPEEWKKVARDFELNWQFPFCLGAIDGRHINFRAPISEGSYYFNYKGNHSIVLLAVADAHYRFIYVNIGINGRVSDGGVFRECSLSKAMKTNILNLPPKEFLPGMEDKVPYVFIADSAFPLSENLMKPYPQRCLTHDNQIYNYRLSRARRIIENSFGILANRFRILLTTMNLNVCKVEQIVLTCVLLHNYLATENNRLYTEYDTHSELELCQINTQGGNKCTQDARLIRQKFTTYFNSPDGSVPWQEEAINRSNL